MTDRFPFSRATLALALCTPAVLALTCARAAQAFTPAHPGHGAGGESTPLNLGAGAGAAAHTSSSGGPSIVRTIVGLLIVIAVIWGLTWILKQVKSGRESRSAGEGLHAVATLALGSGRSLHLVRVGADHLLLGSAEHGVTPIHRYTAEQARDAGLLGPDEEELAYAHTHPGHADPGRAQIQMPGPRAGAKTAKPAQSALERLREWTVRR